MGKRTAKKDTESKPVAKKATTKKREIKAESKTKTDDGSNKTASGSGAIEVMLAQTYDPTRDDPSGWLMSEKMDGVRCYWSGTCLYTRTGKLIFAPKEWKDQLPKLALDGELWSGRDDF